MTQTCPECGRVNTLQRVACIYCGSDLPGVATTVGAAEGPPVMPDDLDQLVRQAMTLGTTAHLEKAIAAQAEAQRESEEVTDDAPSRRELLTALEVSVQAAILAEDSGREGALMTALDDARRVLKALPQGSTQPQAPPAAPTVLLPKVRRQYALVVEGVGDVDAHEKFVTHLDIDGVTARMVARARQPRIALRSDDESDLNRRAEALSVGAGVKTAVISPGILADFGPAHLLTSFEAGPQAIEVNDWTADLHALMERTPSLPLDAPPRLVVPGELVFQRFRQATGGGRLKHLRERKLDPGRQVRLQVVDLHLPERIVRIFEGATDVAHAPGASEDGFHRTLAHMLQAWSDDAVRVLPSRTLEPVGHQGQADERGGILAHPWPQWEEHSRSSRALYLSD